MTNLAESIKLYLSKYLQNSQSGSFDLKDMLNNMPASIGHSKVYCADQWPEQGYRVQAVYNNTHVWKDLALKFDKLII